MKLKKFAALLLAGVMASSVVLAGCSKNDDKDVAAGAQNSSRAASVQDDSSKDASLDKVLNKKEFVLGLDATFKPMGFTDENDCIVGFDIDVATELCARWGIKLTCKSINWDTKEQELNAGNIDCIWNGMSINASRKKAMILSEPYMENEMVFVVKNDSPIASQNDLDGKKVAVQSGSSAQEILDGASINVSQNALATNVEALQQLESGLVDAVFMDSVVAEYEISTSKKDYRLLPDGLEKEQYAIGFRKNDAKLRDKVQETLSDMKKDGKLKEISTKWFGKDITTVK